MKKYLVVASMLLLSGVSTMSVAQDSSKVLPNRNNLDINPGLTVPGTRSAQTSNYTGRNSGDINLQNQINSLRTYVDGHFNAIYGRINNLESQINSILGQINNLNNRINGLNNDLQREVGNLNIKIDRSGGSNCGSRKHGQVYNVQTGGGDDTYYSTLYQCLDGSTITIGKNNMAH